MEKETEVLEVSETAKVEKPKWSLKKKLIIAGAAVAGLVLGAVALSIKKAPTTDEDQAESFDAAEEITDEVPEEAETAAEESTDNSGV